LLESRILPVGTQTESPDLQGPDPFLKGLFEGAPDGPGFGHGFHWGGQKIPGFGKFFKGPPGNFHHAVIQGGFEGGHGFAGDIVGDFIQGIPHGQLGGNFCDGKSRGL